MNTTLSLLTFEWNLVDIVKHEVNSSEDSSNDPLLTVVVHQDHTTLTTRVDEEDTLIKQIINDNTEGNIYLGKDKDDTMYALSYMGKSFDTSFFANIVNNNNTFSSYSIWPNLCRIERHQDNSINTNNINTNSLSSEY